MTGAQLAQAQELEAQNRLHPDVFEVGMEVSHDKYGIGEIVLVVIGILIALSINNWNEARKLAIEEIEILKGIKQNILMDTIDLNHNIRRFQEMYARDTLVINHLVAKKPIDDIVEDQLTDLWRSNITLTLHTSYFDEAKTKGLSIISFTRKTALGFSKTITQP